MKCTVDVCAVRCKFLSMVLHVTSKVLHFDMQGICSIVFKDSNVTFEEAESTFICEFGFC